MTHRQGLNGLYWMMALVVLVCGLCPASAIAAAGREGGSTGTTVYVSRLSGVVSAIDASSITLRTDGGSRTLPLGHQIVVLLGDGTLGAVSQVRSGMRALVYARGVSRTSATVSAIVILGDAAPSSATPVAITTQVAAPTATAGAPLYSALNGTITALEARSLTIQTADASHTYALSEQVSVRLANRQAGTLAQVTVPQAARVYVRYTGR